MTQGAHGGNVPDRQEGWWWLANNDTAEGGSGDGRWRATCRQPVGGEEESEEEDMEVEERRMLVISLVAEGYLQNEDK
jgi:hypothetical protein